MNIAPFLLVGVDFEGDSRELAMPSLEQGVKTGKAYSVTDASGPAWQCWAVWGNHGDNWQVLAFGQEVKP